MEAWIRRIAIGFLLFALIAFPAWFALGVYLDVQANQRADVVLNLPPAPEKFLAKYRDGDGPYFVAASLNVIDNAIVYEVQRLETENQSLDRDSLFVDSAGQVIGQASGSSGTRFATIDPSCFFPFERTIDTALPLDCVEANGIRERALAANFTDPTDSNWNGTWTVRAAGDITVATYQLETPTEEIFVRYRSDQFLPELTFLRSMGPTIGPGLTGGTFSSAVLLELAVAGEPLPFDARPGLEIAIPDASGLEGPSTRGAREGNLAAAIDAFRGSLDGAETDAWLASHPDAIAFAAQSQSTASATTWTVRWGAMESRHVATWSIQSTPELEPPALPILGPVALVTGEGRTLEGGVPLDLDPVPTVGLIESRILGPYDLTYDSQAGSLRVIQEGDVVLSYEAGGLAVRVNPIEIQLPEIAPDAIRDTSLSNLATSDFVLKGGRPEVAAGWTFFAFVSGFIYTIAPIVKAAALASLRPGSP